MGSTLATEQPTVTRIQGEVIKALIDYTLKYGCPPTSSRICHEMGRDVRSTLRQLKQEGYLLQAYTHGPYVPILDILGRPLQLTILPRDIAQEAESKAYRRK